MMENVRSEIERIRSKVEEHEQTMKANKFVKAADASFLSIDKTDNCNDNSVEQKQTETSVMDTTRKTFNASLHSLIDFRKSKFNSTPENQCATPLKIPAAVNDIMYLVP